MTPEIVQRIDAFAYRHRLAEVMRSPVIAIDAAAPLTAAAAMMVAKRVGALAILDAGGRAVGLITDRDLAHHAAKPETLSQPIGAVMSREVASLPPGAFIFEALTDLRRHNTRHLIVADPASGAALGVVSMSALLKLRADDALLLSADAEEAPDAQSLKDVVSALPRLATALMAEGVPPRQIAGALAAVLRDVYARVGALAEGLMLASDGPAPAGWCFLVLGSAGRGESLLAADQDHALVHDGAVDDYPWFEKFGRHCSAILDEIGIPFCRGDVMASNRECRHNLAGWRKRIGLWVASDDEVALLNADIFFDFRPAYGDLALAAELRKLAAELGRQPMFLKRLAASIGKFEAQIGLFGGMKTKGGRLNLKRGALLPIVSGARVLSLSLGSTALETELRWEAARKAGRVSATTCCASPMPMTWRCA
ncbi:MAG: CBS domain-containing protein [Rhodospirillaceae bacterium]|nr:CBS domain-containing protein [Rhodospirillaceae bacterium]